MALARVLIVVALAVSLMAPLAVYGGQEVTCAAGDANCDGDVNSVDAALVLQVDAGLINPLPFPSQADVYADGALNSRDALLILQFDAGLIDCFDPCV